MQSQGRVDSVADKVLSTQPVIFIGHGTPMVAIEFDSWSDNLCSFIDGNPPPTAIIVLSAHWTTDNVVKITSNEFPEQIYDFQGYPETLYQLTYPCEGNPQLAKDVAALLHDFSIPVQLDEERGLDHGAWIPLYVAFPNADVPVIQISLPNQADPKMLLDLGSALKQLRKQGILLIGSGNLIHNPEWVKKFDKYQDPEQWAVETDDWLHDEIVSLNIDDLIDYQNKIPHKEKALPKNNHILPLFFVLGAITQKDHLVDIYDGFHHANISMRSFAFISNQ